MPHAACTSLIHHATALTRVATDRLIPIPQTMPQTPYRAARRPVCLQDVARIAASHMHCVDLRDHLIREGSLGQRKGIEVLGELL